MLRIRSRDAPEIIAIVWKLLGQRQAKTPMHIRGNDRVLKVIGILIALAAEIEPSLRVLVDEERRERSDVAKAVDIRR